MKSTKKTKNNKTLERKKINYNHNNKKIHSLFFLFSSSLFLLALCFPFFCLVIRPSALINTHEHGRFILQHQIKQVHKVL